MRRRDFLRLSAAAFFAAYLGGLHPQAFHTAAMALALAGLDVPAAVPLAVGAGVLIPSPTETPTPTPTPTPTYHVYLPEIAR